MSAVARVELAWFVGVIGSHVGANLCCDWGIDEIGVHVQELLRLHSYQNEPTLRRLSRVSRFFPYGERR